MALSPLNTYQKPLDRVKTSEVKTFDDEAQKTQQSFAQSMYASASNTQRAIGGMQSQAFHTADIQSRSHQLAADLSKRHVEDKKHLETHDNAHQMKIDRLKAEFKAKFSVPAQLPYARYPSIDVLIQTSPPDKADLSKHHIELGTHKNSLQMKIDRPSPPDKIETDFVSLILHTVQFPPVDKLRPCLEKELGRTEPYMAAYLAEKASSRFGNKEMDLLDVNLNATWVIDDIATVSDMPPTMVSWELAPLINALHACSSEVKEEK